MPVYQYQHPKTEEIFEELRPMSKMDKPFIAPDGVKCKRIEIPLGRGPGIVNKNAEAWEKDPTYVKQLKPKYVRYQDGHRERYDPNRHC
jgi:hypothetical protein